MKPHYFLALPLTLALAACNDSGSSSSSSPVTPNPSNQTPTTLTTSVKTDTSYGDIADAAIWVHPSDTSKNLLIVTLEEDGLAIYDNQGKELENIEGINALGADIRYGISDGNGGFFDLLAVGLPDEEEVSFYRINPNGENRLDPIGRVDIGMEAESICLYKNVTTNALTVTGVAEDGTAKQFKLKYDGDDIINVRNGGGSVRNISVGGELSACIIDDQSATLYVGEQNIGIWAYGADIENIKERRLVDSVEPLGHLEEIEGLELAYMPNGKGYLVAADEGKGLVMYQRSEGNKYVNTVTIEGIDETKALAIAPDAFWLANTELEEPVYEKLSVSDIGSYLQRENVELANLISHRDLTVDGVKLVKASGETAEVNDDGDAADDPAFWLNTGSPENSLIIATNKQGGLMAYDLRGNELQYLEEGKPNNVDIREVTIGGKKIALAAASNREYNTIALYKIQENTDQQEPIIKLNAVGDSVHSEVAELASNLSEVYGLCMYYDGSSPFVFINGKSGKVEQWKLSLDGDNVEGSLVRTFSVDSQPEGCVADDKTDTLYLGEENVGIWSFSAQENSGTDAVEIARIDNAALTADVEGLTIYDNGSDKYLIASSQGSNSYAAYDLNDNNKLKGTFAIIGDDSKNIDGASDTDGVHAVFANLGPDYPKGMFIAQDWNNINADYEAENQNFKMVSMKEILDSL